MQRSIFSAVSGLKNHQTRMDVIGNNIANVNTVGFKESRVEFKEGFAQTLQGATRPVTGQQGGVNPEQVGLGMQVASIDQIFSQGNLENTGVPTDMAIQGNDFFVVRKGSDSFYTRAGNFQLEADGHLVSPTNGYVVQGKMAVNGVLQNGVQDIVIPSSLTVPAKQTDKIGLSGNLDASAPNFTGAFNATNMADPANAHSWTQTTLAVYDSLGLKHDLTVQYYKTGPAQWTWQVDPTNLNYDTAQPTQFTGGVINFTPTGVVDSTTSTFPDVKFSPIGNGNPVDIVVDPGTGTAGLTSYVGGTSAVIDSQNGYAAGQLTSYTVDHTGTIVGVFSNGTTQDLAQVALASFNNNSGLSATGDNMYKPTPNSGEAKLGFAGRESASSIASGQLEMSNVDLAEQFTDMIITERGYQANSKMITTSDEMLQELVNLRR